MVLTLIPLCTVVVLTILGSLVALLLDAWLHGLRARTG